MIRCADMNQNIENMVESLTNLVNDAKGVLRRFGEGNCSEKNGTLLKPSCSVNDSLKSCPQHWESCCKCSLGMES